MRWNFVRHVMSKEILSTIRDRRTLVSMIVLPLVMIPLFFVGLPVLMGRMFGGESERRQSVGVVNFAAAPKALQSALREALELKNVQDATQAVQNNEAEAALVIPPNLPTFAGGPSVPVAVHYKQSSQKGELLFRKINTILEAYGKNLVRAKLQALNLPESTVQPVIAQPVSADSSAERASGVLAFMIPYFILNWILSGGTPTAIDSTAGEKERGTLESLLVAPVKRLEVVLGKTIATVIFSIVSTVVSMVALLLSRLVAAVVLPLFVPKSGSSSEVSNAFGGDLKIGTEGYAQLLLLGLSVAVLFGCLLIAICIFARSFKEAQTYITPVGLLLLVPMMMLQFSEFVQKGPALYATPILGASMVILDVVKGINDWGHAGLAMLVNLVVSAALLVFALRSFSQEQVLFRN